MSARPSLFTGVAAAATLAWTALVLWFGYFRFDDFWSIGESLGAHLFSAAAWTVLTADGRWQPLMKASFAAVAGAAGTASAWPFYLAVTVAHLGTAVATAMLARHVWSDRRAGTYAFGAVLAALNLSAFSLASIATLHGVSSVAAASASAWMAVASIDASRSRARIFRIALAAAFALASCLYKETGIATPAIAIGCVWLGGGRRRILAAGAGPALGVIVYVTLRWMLDVPWLPRASRYEPGTAVQAVTNGAVLLLQVMPWLIAAAAGTILTRGTTQAVRVIAIGAAVTLIVCGPSLLLSWRSPNFWYAALPITAVAVAGLLHASVVPARAVLALTVLTIVTLAATAAIAARGGAQYWGPYARTALADWQAQRGEGPLTIWIDLDAGAPYGGLARMIGPGERLQEALRLASGDRALRARLCVPISVGSLYVHDPSDELFVHTRGRLTRVDRPPDYRLYCLP